MEDRDQSVPGSGRKTENDHIRQDVWIALFNLKEIYTQVKRKKTNKNAIAAIYTN